MMLLDAIIAGLLVITASYCYRLNRKIAGFRNAKTELEHMIRSFDASIRQAYESIAILKENSSDKNIQLIRDMEKVRFLANDLAFLVEKGEKLADSLEVTVRQNRVANDVVAAPTPVMRPRAAVRPQAVSRPAPQPRSQIRETIDALARSYVTDHEPAPAVMPPSLPPRALPARAQLIEPSSSASPEQRAKAIEKVLNHMAAKNARSEASMPAVPPRKMVQATEAPAAKPATKNRFFDTLRVITPTE